MTCPEKAAGVMPSLELPISLPPSFFMTLPSALTITSLCHDCLLTIVCASIDLIQQIPPRLAISRHSLLSLRAVDA
jgi:hypothetical protein